MIMTRQKNYRRFTQHILLGGIFLLVSSAVYAADSSGQSEQGTDQADKAVELNFEVTKGDYEYQIENRPDPFVPFFTGETETEPTLDPNEIIESGDTLSGMQLFEPGQLNLVALLKSRGKYLAMVEDFTGRGYVVSEGMKIGRRGVIKEISSNKVFIEEIAMTRAGKELRSEIVMALRKEGEE